MEAALAEMTTDDVKEAEDDNDFFVEKGAQMVFDIIGPFCDGFNFFSEEEDMFESDFESTDEEAAQGDAVAGEATVQEEEKRVRKVSYI
jgi:hypothetical protein